MLHGRNDERTRRGSKLELDLAIGGRAAALPRRILEHIDCHQQGARWWTMIALIAARPPGAEFEGVCLEVLCRCTMTCIPMADLFAVASEETKIAA